MTVGHVRGVRGLTLTAEVPDARRGDWLQITKRDGSVLDAEVIAFDDVMVTLMPLGALHGVGPGDPIARMGNSLAVRCGRALLGRVVDGIGRPIDGGAVIEGELWPLVRPAPSAFRRPRIARVFPTGVRAIDALCTMGEGQRIGLFAPAGVGKTTLLGRIAAASSADVVVACLIGERGRELNEFMQDALGTRVRARSVVVCATSDAPALERVKSAHVATTFAEYFRAHGLSVLLVVDSLTRFVRAAREVGLAAGEPPARRGFPPSAFSELAPLLERAGLDEHGAITSVYTVLVEGNDLDEPVSDEVRGILDGHLVLDRAIAQRGSHPAIDVTKSLSRSMHDIVTAQHRQDAERLRALLSHYETKRDLVELGAVEPGRDAMLDRALSKLPAIHAFLQQPNGERAELADTLERLHAL